MGLNIKVMSKLYREKINATSVMRNWKSLAKTEKEHFMGYTELKGQAMFNEIKSRHYR